MAEVHAIHSKRVRRGHATARLAEVIRDRDLVVGEGEPARGGRYAAQFRDRGHRRVTERVVGHAVEMVDGLARRVVARAVGANLRPAWSHLEGGRALDRKSTTG